jgi:hypothetical protein
MHTGRGVGGLRCTPLRGVWQRGGLLPVSDFAEPADTHLEGTSVSMSCRLLLYALLLWGAGHSRASGAGR